MYLIYSKKIPENYLDELVEFLPGLNRIAIPQSQDVYDSISSHPDIFLFILDAKTIVYSRDLSRDTIDALKESGIKLIRSMSIPRGTYPDTAPLNALRIGNFIFHNLEHTDAAITTAAKKIGLKMVHTNQGYSRCSSIPVKENALITSDQGIKDAARNVKLDVEIISPGNVELPGQKYGFIGGTTGVLPDSRILFLGDITLHPDFPRIDNFLKKHSVKYIYIPNLPLFDAGSLLFLDSD